MAAQSERSPGRGEDLAELDPGHVPQTRVHAFGDDALGEHDAVGLAAEIRAGRVSRREVVEAAIARTEKLDGVLHGLACRPVRRRRRRVRLAARGLLRRRAQLRQGQQRRRRPADPAGLPGLGGRAGGGGRRLRPDVLPDRHDRSSARPGSRSSGSARAPSSPVRRTRAQPVAHRPHLGRLLGRLGGVRRLGRGPDGARQRRRRLDPDPGRLLRPGRAQADPGPDADGQDEPRDAGADRLRRRGHPLGPRHRRLPPRVRAGLPRPRAAAGRRRHRPGHAAPAGRR